MTNRLNLLAMTAMALFMAVSLVACGGGGSSQDNATVDYVHNLVFRNTTTFATGYNGSGQLGNGSLTNEKSPKMVANGYFFSGFATGGNHSVAFFNNSTVRSWGYNVFGQLGNNSTAYSVEPVKSADISGVIAVSAGARHTIALKNDDTIWAWGDNTFGQLGNNKDPDVVQAIEFSSIPTQIQKVIGFENISSISANGNFNLARANGKVWAWGHNRSGQLGTPPVPGPLETGYDPKVKNYNEIPTEITDLSNEGIVAVSAGGASGYALASDGTVWAWGNNFNGQLGDGTKVNNHIPQRVIKEDGTHLDNIVAISAGVGHVLALDKGGQVWAWGYNIYGQLGNYDKKPNNLAPDDKAYAVEVVADSARTSFTGATRIHAFGSSSMAKKGGVWYVWGDNSYGQLGIGKTGNEMLPVELQGFDLPPGS